jgi:uncharacterized membrane protein
VNHVIDTIAQGDGSRIMQARRAVARDDREWQTLWAAHAGPESDPPRVDFDTRMVVAVFAGQRPAAWHVEIVSSRADADAALAILIDERRGSPGAAGAPLSSSPYHIASLPRHTGSVHFAAAPRAVAAGRGTPRGRDGDPSSTGLEPTTAGALAYLAGPLSGSLMLAVEQTSRFVRFHAWQALLGLGVLGFVAVVCLGLAFLLLLLSPTAFWTMLWVAAALGVTWVALWAFCVLQAYRGVRWKMPLAGGFAERRAYK